MAIARKSIFPSLTALNIAVRSAQFGAGYAVDEHSMNPEVAVPAFVNVNDKTNEGLKYVGKNIFTVQYHPEACPGPQDSGYLFDRFLRMMEEER